MFSCCQRHRNIDILAPRVTNKAAKQQSWCQNLSSAAKQQHSSTAAEQQSSRAAEQRCQMNHASSRARGKLNISPPSGQLPIAPKIDHFYNLLPKWPHITISHYKQYRTHVFIMPNATEISIFWHPEAPIKQLCSKVGTNTSTRGVPGRRRASS